MILTPSRVLPLVAALALVLPASAFAQASGSTYITSSTAPSGVVYAPGTSNATLGTFTLTGTQPGSVSVASVPITISGTGGASAANLSGCTVANSAGTTLNTGAHAFNAMSTGSNSVIFDVPLSVNNVAPQTLTLRCAIASTAPSGASYSYTIGTPTLAPSLAASLTTFPNVSAGEQNAPLAAVTLNPGASGGNLNLTSTPLAATYSGGLTPSMLSNCRLTNAGSVLNRNGSGVLNAGANTFALDTAFPLAGGGAVVPLILSCTISPAAPRGGAVTLALAPSGIRASSAVGGTAVTPSQSYTASGASPISGTISIGSGTNTGGGVTPPNTGAGAGAPLALLAMALSALAALASLRLLLGKSDA